MIGDDSELEEVRVRLVQLLRDDEYRIEEDANREGRNWFRQFVDYPTEYNLISHILKLLEKPSVRLSLVQMRSGGIAYRIFDPAHHSLYIKVMIEDEKVSVVSFHRSVYH